jgi:predicted nucleic acid-binding OB-fold protein
MEVLRKGVKGWENFHDEKGKLVQYHGDKDLDLLPMAIQQDLQVAIMERYTLTEEELRGLE